MSEPRLSFRAIVAPISTSLKFGGDAGRVTFEVPQSDVESAVGLIALQNVVLRVTVEVEPQPLINNGATMEDHAIPEGKKRKSVRTRAQEPRAD